MSEKKEEERIETPLLNFAEKITNRMVKATFSILKGVVKEAKKALKSP